MKQALILAAGRGARLDRPNTPKPLVDIGGQPLIVRLIHQLKRNGIETIHIVVGYESSRIMNELASHFGFDSNLVFHRCPEWEMGSAHSVLAAEKWMSGAFLLSMGDHFFDDALIQKMTSVDPGNDVAVVLTDKRTDKILDLHSAVKVCQENNRIVDVGVGLTPYTAVDAGLFCATPVLFDVLRNLVHHQNHADLVDGIKVLAKTESLSCIEVENETWFDVDSPRDVVAAEMYMRKINRTRRLRTIESAPNSAPTTSYDYKMQTNEYTAMIFQKGLVASPEQFSFIPDHSASSPIFVFTDETVGRLYGQTFVQRLRARGYDVHSIQLVDGEESKTISNYVYLVERVLSRGVDERSVFISLGGGVVCNVCGFVASTIYRGLDLIHIPTTLMAQSDASISHKQAINGHSGKNMVGSYYFPRAVLIDVDVLQTLTDRQIKDGFAEIIKHALGQEPSLVDLLLSYDGDLRNPSFLEDVIKRTVQLKCQLVKNDPKELREAMVLQYGHTAGHPIEHLSGYTLYHGESVAIGMMFAARVSRILGACDDQLVSLHQKLIEKYGLPTAIPKEIVLTDFLEALKYNKRHVVEGSQMALLEKPGILWQVHSDYVIPVSEAVLTEAFFQTQDMSFSLEKWISDASDESLAAVGI